MRFLVPSFALLPPLLLLLFLLAACGSDTDDASTSHDAGVVDAASASPDGSPNSSPDATPDATTDGSSALQWHAIRSPADPLDDCLAVDTSCSADLEQVWFAVADGKLRFAVQLASAFPQDQGTLELFVMPVLPPMVGYSVRTLAGVVTVWKADCSSATASWRHAGCHWSVQQAPDSLETVWVDETRFEIAFDPTSLFGEPMEEMRVGVGAAPFAIQKTAEFTDRYPDEVLVTSTEIQGLVNISLLD